MYLNTELESFSAEAVPQVVHGNLKDLPQLRKTATSALVKNHGIY